MLTDRRIRSEQYHRDQFIGAFVAATGKPPHEGTTVHQAVEIAAQLIALGKKYHRLQEQQCNGDGYYRPGARDPYPLGSPMGARIKHEECRVCEEEVPELAMVGSDRVKDRAGDPQSETRRAYRVRRRQCIDCRTREQIRQLLPDGWRVRFSGDPRGPVVRVAFAPDARWDWNSGADRWEGADGKPAGPDGRHKLLGAEPRWLVVS